MSIVHGHHENTLILWLLKFSFECDGIIFVKSRKAIFNRKNLKIILQCFLWMIFVCWRHRCINVNKSKNNYALMCEITQYIILVFVNFRFRLPNILWHRWLRNACVLKTEWFQPIIFFFSLDGRNVKRIMPDKKWFQM